MAQIKPGRIRRRFQRQAREIPPPRFGDNGRQNHSGATFSAPFGQRKDGFHAGRAEIKKAGRHRAPALFLNDKKGIVAHRMAIPFRHRIRRPGLEDRGCVALTTAVANGLIADVP